jgi:GTP-binding protein
MIIKTAEFLQAANREDACPKGDKPEFVFIGRSNVGKSSLINMLVNFKDLARVSQNPGKTQTINYYVINGDWYLIDLPGYGYARTSKVNRKAWGKMIQYYILNHTTVCCTFVLIDGYIEPQEMDIAFINWLGEHQIPFVIIFTKADRPKKRVLDENIKAFEKRLLETWETMPTYFVSSAEDKTGREDILKFIENTIQAE